MVQCKLAPSILTADLARLGEQIGAAEQAGVEYTAARCERGKKTWAIR